MNQASDRHAIGVTAKDAQNDLRLDEVDAHAVPLRPGPAVLVEANLPRRFGAIPERGLADEEAPRLLPLQAPEGLLPKVGQLQLVEDAAHLDAEHRVLIRGVETVGHRDDPNAVEAEILQDQEQERVVTREAREIVDQHHLEQALPRGVEQSLEGGPVSEGSGHGRVRVEMRVRNDDVVRRRGQPANTDLILDRLDALILGAVAGVDGTNHEFFSSAGPLREGLAELS